MNNKVFVGGLSWSTDDQGLRQAFEKFGEINEVRVIKDRDTGRSRGFGFVTFSENAAVNRAIEAMNGTDLDGRNIKVNQAEDKPRTPSRGGGGDRGDRGHGGGGGGGDRGGFRGGRR